MENGPEEVLAHHPNEIDVASTVVPDEVDSWDALADILTGWRPDQIPSLTAARELELIYPFLHALTRGSLAGFILRTAVLEALVTDGRSPLSPSTIAEVLYWLKEPVREQVMRTLRVSGWLTYEPSAGYRISPGGQFVATVLSFLRAKARDGDLLPTLEGIDYMLRLGVDPVRQVLLLRSRLEDLRNVLEEARSSHSEVIIQGASARLQEALALSERIRSVLSQVPLEMSEARRAAHDVHDLLSRLHGVGSDLHAAMTEIGRQYLHLVGGLTTADIISTLMKLPIEELAATAQSAMRPLAKPPVFVIPELLCAEAEAYLSRQLRPPEDVRWSEPPEPSSANATFVLPVEISAFLDDLDRFVACDDKKPFAEFIPRRTASESFLRATLLPLLHRQIGGDGVAGRLGSLPVSLQTDGDGWPVSAPSPLSELSPGIIRKDRIDE